MMKTKPKIYTDSIWFDMVYDHTVGICINNEVVFTASENFYCDLEFHIGMEIYT